MRPEGQRDRRLGGVLPPTTVQASGCDASLPEVNGGSMQWPIVSHPSNGLTVPPLSGTSGAPASTPQIIMTELKMLLKSIQAFVPDFPKLEMGDPSARAS